MKAAGIQSNKLKLAHSQSLHFTDALLSMVNPQGTIVSSVIGKVRFTCPKCRTVWTSGIGLFGVMLNQKRVKRGGYAIDFKVIVFGRDCKHCNVQGEFKPYEDEMERIAAKAAKMSLEAFGFAYGKEEKLPKKS